MNQIHGGPLVVHEAERQRQHLRVRVPLTIEIGNRRCEAFDWSVAGFSVPSADFGIGPGEDCDARLVLAFVEFEFDLKVRCQLVYANADSGRSGFRLINQNQRQLSVLQFMVDAYLSGEIVQVSDLFDVARRDNFTTAKQIPRQSGGELLRQRFRRWLFGFGVLALTVGLLALIATSLYERLYVVSPVSAVVTADLVQIAAPQGGRLAISAAVRSGVVQAGMPLLTITTPGGAVYNVDSPCDCEVVDVLASDDSQVGVDTSLLLMVPVNSQTHISALVPYEDALRLDEGAAVLLTHPAGDGEFQGTIADVDLRRQLTELGQPLMDAEAVISAEVTIIPDQPMPMDWIGMPVGVRIDVFEGDWLGGIFGDDV